MASSGRLALRRSAFFSVSSTSPITRPAITISRTICSASVRTYARLSKASSGGLLAASSIKPQQFVEAASIYNVQTRSYADKVIKVPQMAESISEGTLKQWRSVITSSKMRKLRLSRPTRQIDVAVNAPESGTILELLAQEEDTVTVGQDLLRLEVGGSKPPATAKAEPETKTTPEPTAESKPAPPPQEKKPEAPKQPEHKQEKPQPQAQTPKIAANQPFGNREERRVKMNRMRLRIAERLKQSQNTAASLTTFNEVDMSALMEMRKLYKDEILKKTGVKLGFMSAFSRACVLAMKDVPAVNASIEGPNGGDTIVYRDYVDISVAVATEKGLVTPVVRNAENLDFIGIEQAIAELGKKARDNKLTIEDMAGGTFTISNGGVFGSLMGTPIINLPQTAVLGLHAIKERPVAVNGKVEIRPMMYLALTYDHRLLDGREAVTFLIKIKEYIEDPRRMLLA
ncbi:2-oxoglutarate dehydrogenase complex E2 component [Rhizina undulata]